MPFDPSKPFELVPAPAFDPAKPFELVEEKPPSIFRPKNAGGLFAQGALDQGVGSMAEGGLRLADTLGRNVQSEIAAPELIQARRMLERSEATQRAVREGRMKADPVYDRIAEQARARLGELTPAQQPALNAIAQKPGLIPAAKKVGEFRQAVREVYPVDQEVQESIPGQVVQGVGQALGGLPLFLTGLGLPASAAQMFDQGYQDATQSGADLETAAAAGIANVPAAVLEQLGDKFQLGAMVKALRGNAQGAKQIVKTALNAFAGEAGTEALQQGHQNAVAQALYAKDRELTEGMGTAALVGGLTGATVATGTTALGEGIAALDTRKNLAETAATLKAQQEQLLAGRRPAQMFPANAEGKVTNELPLPEGMKRLETERGVFHYNPKQITADEIYSASAKGAENRALALGSTSKPEAEAAAAKNKERLVTVTERTPEGTEVRSSVINLSAAEKTAAEMQPGLTPGNSLVVETPEKTLAGRKPDFLADILNKEANALAERQAAEAKEKTAREQRQRDLDAKKENVSEAMQQGAAVLQDRAATFADVQGALKRVQFYAENNALGITQDQRIGAQRQQAKLAQRLAVLEPAELARRDLENQQRLADDAAALAARKAQRTQAKQEFKQEEKAGRDATGALDYMRLAEADLVTRAEAGDKKAEKVLMDRNDAAGDDRPTLLDVLAQVKLPGNDAALGGELKLLAEGMTPQQRRQLIATKETNLDAVAETLRADHGFSQIQTPSDVIDFVERALRGEDIRPDRTGEGQVEFATRKTTAPAGPADPAPRTDFRDAEEQKAYLRNPDNFNDRPFPGVVKGTPLWIESQAIGQKSLDLDAERRRQKLSFDQIKTIAQRATGKNWTDFTEIADYDRTLAELRNPGSQFGKFPGGQTEIEFATIQDTFDLGGTPVGIDLPNAVRNLTPRWQEKTLAFQSSLDKALYYAGGTNSETRDLVAARLAEQTGLTTGQIATLARQLRTRIEPLTRSAATTGTIRVPAQMRSDVAQLTGVEFASNEDQALTSRWREIATDPAAFQFPKSDSPDPQKIAQDLTLPGFRIWAEVRSAKVIVFHSQLGGELYLKNSRDGWKIDSVDAAPYDRGARAQGAQLYQAALTWAFNNREVIQPAGQISGTNELRRTSAMLSSALRTGTTDHMLPHADQRVPWVRGDHEANIAALARREAELAKERLPEIAGWRTNSADGSITDSTGQRIPPDDVQRTIQSRGGPTWHGVGIATLRRALRTGELAGESARLGNDLRKEHDAGRPGDRGILYAADGSSGKSVAGADAPAKGLDNATIERELTALLRAFPRLAVLFKLRIGSIRQEFDEAAGEAGYKGQIPSNVEAAVWGQKRLIVIAARAWRDRNNGAALVTHEVAHLFWDTLPADAKDQLRALHAKETGTKTGPLYTKQGFMRGSIQFERDRLPVARVAADPDLPVKEWFAERIAIINKAWAEGRLDRTEAPLLRRIADELRQLYRRIVEAFATRSNIDPDSELFEAQFRAFILAGADVQIGRNAGTSYAQKKAQFATRPSFATGERPAVPAWPDNFPNVVVMTTVPNLYAQGGYEAAKAGDAKAALDVVLTAARENKFFDLQKRFPDAILVPVRALERAGNNRLPGEFAAYFGHVTGLRVDAGIVQTNQTGHTGSGSDYRMAHRPSFDGAVIPGQTYIIVDDVVTMGGTLGELRAHIESRGGKVGAITTLAAAQFSAQIALTPKTKLALETKFDQVALREWLRQNDIYGGEFGALTEAEGRWLLAAKTLDAAGDRIAAQRRQGDARGIAGEVGNPAPEADPGVKFASSVNDYVAANETPPEKVAAARADIEQILGVARDEQLELISYDGGSDLPRANPAPAGRAGDDPAALQRAAAALKAPTQSDAVRAAYGIDPRDPNYAGSERISSIIPALVADPKRSWDIRGAKITTARDVMTLAAVMRSPYVETAKIILLNRDNVVVHSEIVGIGSVSAAIMDASQLGALLNRAPASKDGYNIIFSHNHPGGNPEPSKADNKLTRDLRAMLAKTKHTLVDHVITNGDTFYSYREQGLMNFGQQPVTTTKPRARGKDADTTVEPGATAPWEIVRRGELLPATSYTVTRELLASLRQVDPTALHIVYLNIRNLVTALERVPNFQLPGDANTEAELEPLTSKIFSGLGREGAKGFIIIAPDTMKAGTAARVMRHLKEFATDGNFYLLDYASSQLTQDSTAAAIGLLEPRPEQGGNALAEPGPDSREDRLQQIRDELDQLQNSQEDQTEINARGQALTDERDRLQAEQRAEQREKQVESSIIDVRHPAAVGTPEPGEAWMMVPRMTDAQLRQERMDVGQHLVDNYQELGRMGRALLHARIDAIRAEEARRAPQPRRNAEGNALVEPIPKTSRRDALIAELKRGREMAGEANRTGNDEALKEGTRLVRLAKERLDEEFPGWETAARPTTAQAPSAAPDATDTQPGAISTTTTTTPPPKPPAPPIAEAAQPDDAEPSPFTGESEEKEPIRKGKINQLYGQSSSQPSWLARTWKEVREIMTGIRGPIPELPVFPAAKWNAADTFIREKGATFYNKVREFYRDLKSGNDYVQRSSQEQVTAITRPLLMAGGKFQANAYAKLQARQEQARKKEAERQPVPPGVLAEIAALNSQLESHPYVLFNRLVMMLDHKWRKENLTNSAGNPIDLPAGINLTEITSEVERLRQTIQAGPHTELIRTALERHMQLVKDTAAELQSRELMSAEELANPYYFPHLTLQIARPESKVEQRELTPARVRPGTEADFRGYLQPPVGSTQPIETDYVRAMYFHLVQVGAHNLKADLVKEIRRTYDVMGEIRERAKVLTRQRGYPVGWEQVWETEYKKRGYDLFGTDSRDAFPSIMVDQDLLAQRLGVALTGEDMHQQLARLGAEGVRLLPDDFKIALAQGARETWVIPVRVAEALRGIHERETRGKSRVEAASNAALQAWKGWKLFAPHNHIRYEYGNLVGDLEKIFSATPGTFKEMPAAASEIRAFWLGGTPSPDLAAAVKESVINTITAQEMAGLVKLKAFGEFETTTQKIWQEIKAIGSAPLSNATRLFGGDGLIGRISGPEQSAFREAVFRYANYKHNLGRLRAGERPDYAGAYHQEIDAMRESRPGAGDQAIRQAAQISKATFGDYGDLSIFGQFMRRHISPFFSWTEVNFRYHANLLRNLRDMRRSDDITPGDALTKSARALLGFSAGFTARAAGGLVLRLAFPYVIAAMWNSYGDNDELEKLLSTEDRRRFHIIIGVVNDLETPPPGFEVSTLTDGRKILVLYGNTAFMDVFKWISGPTAAQQIGAFVQGKTDFKTALAAWREAAGPDFVNNAIGGLTPMLKTPATLMFGKNPGTDVTDMRTVPAYDMRRVILGQMFDDFTADMIERVVNKDYYAAKDFATWGRQLILQLRPRDPEQYAYYDIRQQADDFEYAKTGKRSKAGERESPDAQALSSFKRAINRGDIEAATKFYQRLLGYGYTAEQFKTSIRNQDPLAGLSKTNGLRQAFIDSLTPFDQEQLKRAYIYYGRMNSQRGEERGLFPSQRSGAAGLQRFRENPQVDRLRQTMENNRQLDDDARRLQAERALRESLKKTR